MRSTDMSESKSLLIEAAYFVIHETMKRLCKRLYIIKYMDLTPYRKQSLPGRKGVYVREGKVDALIQDKKGTNHLFRFRVFIRTNLTGNWQPSCAEGYRQPIWANSSCQHRFFSQFKDFRQIP